MAIDDRPRTSDADLTRIRAYYDQTWLDYRCFWLNPRNRAIHFGYWGPGVRTHSQSLVEMNRQLADSAGITSQDRILDAGCGVGGSSLWLAGERGARVVGITPVPSQIHRARRYARRRGLDHLVTFEQQDYLRTSFDDASFDVVWAQESVTHTDRKPAFMAEAYRVLRPGGRLIVVDFFRWTRPYPPEDEAMMLSATADWASPDLATIEEFAEAIESAGFIDVTSRDISVHVAPSLRRLHRVSTALWPLGVALHTLGIRTSVQHGNLAGARKMWKLYLRQRGHESIVFARKPER